jgi:hypothetical protein
MMMQRGFARALLIGAACLIGGPVLATPTATFEVDSFKELDEGKPIGSLIASDGRVLPGRGTQKLTGVEAKMIWSRARGADGAVYFGTGDGGRILRVKGNRVKVIAKLDTILVTALAWSPRGRLLAATMPDARILEVNPSNGKWRELLRLPVEHVWALHYHRNRKRVYASTGAPAKLFEFGLNGGKPTEYFAPDKEQHLLCLAEDPKGNLLTGGSDRAILYRVVARKKALAVHDFDATELRAVTAADDGTIHVAVNKFPRKVSGVPRFDRPGKDEGGTGFKAKSGKKPKVKPQDLRPGAKMGKGALFRIDPQGRVEELLALGKGYFTDLARDNEGVVWAADGSDGKVYMVLGKRSVTTVFDLDERQVLALAIAGSEPYLGTGDSGAIYRVLPQPQKAPAYESKVFDAKLPANWGTVQYRASAPISLMSRSGNTAKPDDTWGAWSAANMQADSRAKLTSPASRYLQIKTIWRKPARGALRGFKLYYRALNQRARVTEIDFERKRSAKDSANTKIKIKWKVDNPDKDKLVYQLAYREESGTIWRPIETGDEPLTKDHFEWDTESIPDDVYRIRVIASDELVNGVTTTLRGGRFSAPLIVDNRRPDVVGIGVRFPWVSGLARDTSSPIREVAISIDGGDWRLIDALDQIYDSTSESFRTRLPDELKPGPHVIAVRVRDEAGNLGVKKQRFVRR